MKQQRVSRVSIQREIGLRGKLIDFVPMAWPVIEPASHFLSNWHIGAVCEHLEAVTSGEIKRLIINQPPGTMKSRLVCVLWPTWVWIRDPGSRWMFASYDSGLTKRDAGAALKIFESRWFKDRWGDKVMLPKEVSVTNYENSMGGFRFATSVGGKATGRHVDYQVFDDPIKPKELTKVRLEECIQWWDQTMATRARDIQTFRRIGIMQRLHDKDLAGHCIEQGYTLLKLPMRYEPNAAWIRDPRVEEGELLWPERFPEGETASLERTLGSIGAASQLQQRPVPEGGNIFRREWFKFWDVVPDKFDQMIQTWDLAFKGKDDSDFVVGQVWGRKGGEYYLVDQTRARMKFPATVDAIKAMTLKYPKTVAKLVEDKANGPAVCDTLAKEVSGIIMVNPQGGKEARANAVSPLFEAGNIYLPPRERFPWVNEYMLEMESFPFGANDDQVDASTQGLTWLHLRRTNFLAAMKKLKDGLAG